MMPGDRSALERLFYPQGVAIIGSASKGKLGYELVRQMQVGGYGSGEERARLFVVNPKAEGALGASGYSSVAGIGHPVDLAIIASPPATVARVVEDCGNAGVAAAAIITAGFSEIGNEQAERELVEAAHRSGVRFVGPNCAGIVNTANDLYPSLETRPPAGRAAVVAQSGAVGGIMLAWAKQYGLGISKFVSYGNAADLNEIDLLWYLAEDRETDVVALYIESVVDGRRFMEALHACGQSKPVVVIKAGRTTAGQRATLSHTGSMAGEDRVYDAAFAQCGAVRVPSVEEMFDFCKAFLHVPAGIGPRVAIVTNSGGPGVLAADRGHEVGLDVRQPSASVQRTLKTFLPGHCALENPVDLTVQGTGAWYQEALLALLEEYDAAVAINVSTPYLDSMDLARGVVAATEWVRRTTEDSKGLVTAFLPEEIVGESVAHLEANGVANFVTGERAVAAIGLVRRYSPPGRLLSWSHVSRSTVDDLSDSGPFTLQSAAGSVPEPLAIAWLQENGIPVPPFRFAKDAGEAVRMADQIGYPVALKIVSPQILHKSDVGGVMLDVRSGTEARNAYERLARIGRGSDFRGAIIYPMIEGGLEVLVGLSIDPQFGPVVAFGLGGIYTEVWGDVVLRVAPIDRTEAETMIREISALPLLEGARGGHARDLDALADLLTDFSRLPLSYPQLREVDLNPVFLFEQGRGLLVGDVRVIVGEGTRERIS